MTIQSIDFYGLNISVFSRDDLINEIITTIKNKHKKVYFGYSLGYIAMFKKYPHLYKEVNDFDLMVTDGRLFYIFAKLIGAPLKYDISVPFLSRLVMDIANRNKFSIMLVGSTVENNKSATNNLRNEYPNANIYDGHDGGYFSEQEQAITIKKINEVSPDILFIGVSSPIKEQFTTKWKDQINAKIIIPFGGMIDGLAGKVWLTPPILKKLGLATFVRVIQEPKRMLRSRIWYAYETIFKIIPVTIFHAIIKRNKNFFIPSLYGIKRESFKK